MNSQRVTTGVEGLDAMLRGGLLPGTAILVKGTAGVGKTAMGLQFLIAGAQRGETGVYVTFEEFPQSLYRDAASLGLDLRDWEAKGKLHIVFTSPEVLVSSLQDPNGTLHRTLVQHDARRAVVDSMTHFNRITAEPAELRKLYAAVVNGLRRAEVTSLLLNEETHATYHRADLGSLAYICDGIILLRHVEVESAIARAIAVLKLRGSDHAREIRHYHIQEGGLVVDKVFRHREAILSGISRRR